MSIAMAVSSSTPPRRSDTTEVRTRVRSNLTSLLAITILWLVRPGLENALHVAAAAAAAGGTAARRLQVESSSGAAPTTAVECTSPPSRSGDEEGGQTAGSLKLVNDSSSPLFKTNVMVVNYSSPSPPDYHSLDLAGCETRVRNMVFVPDVTVFYFSLEIVCGDSYRDSLVARADLLPFKSGEKTLADTVTIARFSPMTSTPTEATTSPSSSSTSAPISSVPASSLPSALVSVSLPPSKPEKTSSSSSSSSTSAPAPLAHASGQNSRTERPPASLPHRRARELLPYPGSVVPAVTEQAEAAASAAGEAERSSAREEEK
ncbi:hypothetical protein CBR_g49063 [Chara braunii]|uniref:Uncharacterized protein n=1 Tax=Chara braunii TaxID=69332 RepID=A0A388M4G0_CHABU|nr:hypothetical protein CBR_g49063 [Chara braunii]|eukprot:GBG89353.1 hypothetical protein CBR_g49063 [Chara braunii]